MISSLCLRACALNQLLSEKFHYPKYIIEWDISSNNWKTESNIQKILTWYNCLSILVTGFFWPSTFFFIVVGKGIFRKEATVDEIYFQIIICAPIFIGIGLNCVFFKHRHAVIEYVGFLHKFLSEFQPADYNKNNVNLTDILRDSRKELRRILQSGKGDFIGVGLVGCILMFTFGGPVMGFTAYFAQQDSFSITLKYMFPVSQRSNVEHILLRIFSSILVAIGGVETCRTFRYLFVYMIVVSNITSSLIKTIQIDSSKDLRAAVKKYQRMYSIHNKIVEPSIEICFVAIHGGQFLAVFNISGSMIGWKFLSPLAYWVLPFMTVLTVFIIMTAIPFGIFPAEESSKMIKDWKYEYGMKRNITQMCVLKSLRPTGWKLGGYGLIGTEFKSHLWTVIVYNTQDAVLMIMDFVSRKKY